MGGMVGMVGNARAGVVGPGLPSLETPRHKKPAGVIPTGLLLVVPVYFVLVSRPPKLS
jgi:hypothetical protein